MPRPDSEHARRYELRAGEPCLDLVNTVAWRRTEHPVDYLETPEDLLAWGGQAGLIDPGEPGLPASGDLQGSSVDDLARMHALREAIHRVVTAAMERSAPDHDDLAILNRAVSEARARQRLVPTGHGRFAWEWDGGSAADRVLWGVAMSAASLLASPAIDRVRVCAGPGCGWLFVDRSRNRSRRWCDTRDCGNRERVRRHFAARRAAG